MTLYEITEDLLQLQQMLIEAPDDESLIDTIESVEFDLERKSDGYCKVIQNIMADVDAINNEIARLQSRKKVAENAIARLKDAMQASLEATGKSKIQGALFNVTLRNNAPQLPKEFETDKVPKEYWIEQEPKLDKRALLKAVKEGKVEGIDLVRSQSLIIK